MGNTSGNSELKSGVSEFGHGAKSRLVGFLAGKGDSLFGEGDNGVSAINDSIMSRKIGHSQEHVIVV